jgi:hypothetical protein
MSRFLEGNELNLEIENLFKNSNQELILISPFIKLHDRLISTLKTKINDDKLKIIILFGKNENDKSKSMKMDDIEFFKSFPNVEIRYEKNLHAKYYANDSSAILTSMNLYSYSQDNNIEFGILMNRTFFTDINDIASNYIKIEESIDKKSYSFFNLVIEQSHLIYSKKPTYKSALMGFQKNYMGSEVEFDSLNDFFSGKEIKSTSTFKTKSNFIGNTVDLKNKSNDETGYCIRTGKVIPFNIKLSYCDSAFKSWNQFGNSDYPEKFCHFSGEKSNGETSMAKPILNKYWNDAKKRI